MSMRRSARTPGEKESAGQSQQPEYSPTHHMDHMVNAPQQIPTDSMPLITNECQLADSLNNTHCSSLVAIPSMSNSGDELNLPDDFTDFIDPALLQANSDLFDTFLGPEVHDITSMNTVAMPNVNQHADNLQNIDLFHNYSASEPQYGSGFEMPLAQDGQHSQLEDNNVPFNEQVAADQSFPDLVPVNFTGNMVLENYGDYSAPDYWNFNYAAPVQSLHTTPGFSAWPGSESFLPQSLTKTSQYPDPCHMAYQSDPYFVSLAQQQAENFPIDPRFQASSAGTSQQYVDTGHFKSQSTRNKNGYSSARVKNKRRRTEPDSDSEEDTSRIKRLRAQPDNSDLGSQSDGSCRNSSTSAESSLSKPVNFAVLRAGEKPRRCEEKSWVRINSSTKGETTRTARINQFTEGGSNYKIKPLPVGNWQTKNFEFEYNQHNGMDEFKNYAMSAEQIQAYINEYPGQNLRLWIQVAPGDSARRYASKSHSECLFEKCPNRVWAHKGTIEVGNYRVAFDEKHKVYGKGVVDPFDCVGYAHLYCMERFLDFARVCEYADVKVDTRSDMKKEPKGEASFTFGKKHAPERILAERFIKAARLGRLDRTPEFTNYPVHTEYRSGEPKPHQQTLTYAMFKINWDHRAPSQLRQFLSRTMKPSACGIHLGDQEIVIVDKKVQALKAFKKAKRAKQHKKFDYSALYDRFHPEINIRIAECIARRAELDSRNVAGKSRKRKGSRKESLAVLQDSDDSESDFTCNSDDEDDDFEETGNGRQYSKQVRSSQRLRSNPCQNRVDYNQPQDILEYNSKGYPQFPGHAAVNYDPFLLHQGGSTGGGRLSSGKGCERGMSPRSGEDSCSELFAAGGTRYQMPEQPIDIENAPRLTDEEIDKILFLERRKSSTCSTGTYTSIMKSPRQERAPLSPLAFRSASFNPQPVTSSKVYDKNDPPCQVGSIRMTRARYNHQKVGRRSARLACK